MKKLLLFTLPMLFTLSALAQTAPAIQWEHSLGSPENDYAWSVQQTNDGGYIMAGEVWGNNGDVTGFHGGYIDAWVVKLDENGSVQWQHALGGSGYDGAQAVIQTSDGGFIVVGGTTSIDGDVTENHGGYDFWVVKLDPDGVLDWSRTYGGSNDESAQAIEQTNDGGYILVGESRSSDGDVTGNHGGPDCWVVKLNGTGDLQWQRSIGGSGADGWETKVQQTSDDGYILCGSSASTDGDATENQGGYDFWVVKLDGTGGIQWQRSLGSSLDDYAQSIIQTDDGGYVVVGEVDSGDGDVVGFLGGSDYWVVKLDPVGMIQWQRCLGGSDFDTATSVRQLGDGGYIVAGYTRSDDGQVTDYHGGPFGDAWLVRLDSTGELIWQKTLGGTGTDKAFSIEPSSDGGYILAGFSDSNDDDVTGNHGGRDCWVVKLGPDNVGIAELENVASFSLFPNPSVDEVHIEFNFASSASVRLQLFDAAGQLVETRVDEWIPAGKHAIRYSIAHLPVGTYALRLMSGGRTFTRSLVKL